MQLPQPFVRLPFRFDVDALQSEALAFEHAEWRTHPERPESNTAIALVAVDGDPTSEEVVGQLAPTPALSRTPYVQRIFAALNSPIGRSRFMRIRGNGDARPHVDSNYYWNQRIRIHIPVLTTPEVQFVCGDDSVHMAAGECWIFDTWKIHNVINPAPTDRIHLVIDTAGSPSLWKLIDATIADPSSVDTTIVLPGAPHDAWSIEPPAFATVMHPDEQDRIVAWLLAEAAASSLRGGALDETVRALREFSADWRHLYETYGTSETGWSYFDGLRQRLTERVAPLGGTLMMANRLDLTEAIRQLLVRAALAGPASPRANSAPAPARQRKIDRPVIIVSPPRAGSTLLFETLARATDVFTIGGESHELIESIDGLHPRAKDFESNVLTAADATPAVTRELIDAFYAQARDRRGHTANGRPIRLLEKTPKNALRIPFLNEVFPDARFVYLYRDPRQQLASMLEAWRSGRFVTYSYLPGWTGYEWSLLLVPGWRDLIDRPLAEVVAHQWARTTTALLDALDGLAPDRWCVASYDQLVADPQREIERIASFVGLDGVGPIGDLPLSGTTLTPPDRDKWQRNWAEIEPALPAIEPVIKRAEDVFGHVSNTMTFTAAAARKHTSPQQAFTSVATQSVSQLLRQAHSSVLVSTYQTNRLITLRAEGDHLNTDYVALPRPMGIACGAGGRLAVGTHRNITSYRNQPAVAPKLSQLHVRDACFIPRSVHVTGDVAIHDMAYVGDELWFVNTRFSALCTLDAEHSFVPRWRPPFVSAFAAEDRCHLNGMAIVDGSPRYVTTLAVTDSAHGWRPHKEDGGCIVDVHANEIVVEGLSMPHSPRWYNGQLWVLESGHGALARVDVARGTWTRVAELPGFTRGLAFVGPFALIGLSQVRDSLFGGLPLTRREGERHCGVWIVDTRNGNTVGFLRFEGAVHEIFDVQVLRGLAFAEVLDGDHEAVANAFTVPDAVLTQFA